MVWFHRRDRSVGKILSLRLLTLSVVAAVYLAGCHSANIEATIGNSTGQTISLIQVEYPSASFGTQTLGPGQRFKYRFKVLGSGPLKITYTDPSNHEHKSTGPSLSEGSEGQLAVDVGVDGVHWALSPAAKPNR